MSFFLPQLCVEWGFLLCFSHMIWLMFALLFPRAFAQDPFVASYFAREAMAPIVTHAKAEELSSDNCAACHSKEHQDWEKSRHRISYTNQNFLEGYVREKQDRCLHCHAPLKEQLHELKTSPELKLSHEGVNCVACHVREGKVVGSSFHEGKKTDFLKSPRFCAGCHEFDINAISDGQVHLTPVNAQDTYSQWKKYQKAGGEKTCQQCHMPEGRHLFQGAHGKLNPPLKVSQISHDVLKIELVNIGHHYPSGDVFRRLSLEVMRNGKFVEIRSFQRKYVRDESFRIESDTTLEPFVPVEVKIPHVRPVAYRFVYHFLKDSEKKYSQIPRDDQERVVLQGLLK